MICNNKKQELEKNIQVSLKYDGIVFAKKVTALVDCDVGEWIKVESKRGRKKGTKNKRAKGIYARYVKGEKQKQYSTPIKGAVSIPSPRRQATKTAREDSGITPKEFQKKN